MSAVQNTASIILGADPSLYQVEYTPVSKYIEIQRSNKKKLQLQVLYTVFHFSFSHSHIPIHTPPSLHPVVAPVGRTIPRLASIQSQ
jgi:hypothetical protein